MRGHGDQGARLALAAAAAAIAALVLLWPGDAPWINDEPNLLLLARECNLRGWPAPLAMPGSVGVRYGGVTVWYYQAALLLTDDFVWIGAAKTALSLVLLVAGLRGLARVLELPRAPLLVALASPYVYMLIRQLWDNSQTVVVSPLLFWLLARFLRRPDGWTFAALTAVSVWLGHAHLNTALAVFPAGLAALVFGWPWLRRHWVVAGATVAAGLAACVPYGLYVVRHVSFAGQPPAPLGESLLGVALGARYLSAVGWFEFYLPGIQAPSAPVPAWGTALLVGLTGLGLGFFLLGGVLCLDELRRLPRHPAAWPLAPRFTVACLGVVALSVVFFAVTRQVHLPHYLVGTWVAYAWFVWRGMAWVLQARRWAWTFWLHLAAMVLLLAIAKVHIHTHGGSRDSRHGATLANQLAIAREILSHPRDSQVLLDVANYRDYPHALYALLDFLHPRIPPPPPGTPTRRLVVAYRDRDPASGWLTLRVMPLAPADR